MNKRITKKSIITFTSLASMSIASTSILVLTSCNTRNYATPSKRQLAWHDLEQTAFVHFGVNTFLGHE
jgi:hypothetical protein